MERYVSISPTGWINESVIINVQIPSNEGLAPNPYEWDGTCSNRPYYTVYDNETVNLAIIDSYGYRFEVEPIIITNIDILAPEFSISYDKNNGNKVSITAKDVGGTFEVDVPRMDIYKVYVQDKLGNISRMIFIIFIIYNSL